MRGTMRKAIIREYAGFDKRGIIVGTASYRLVGNTGPDWDVSIVGVDRFQVKNEEEARQALIDAGSVRLRSSDGVKR